MHPPILRCLVPGAASLAEPGEVKPLPSLLAIETLTAYLRSVDPRTETSRTWSDFVVDHQIRDHALLMRCIVALRTGRTAAHERKCSPPRCGDHILSLPAPRQQQSIAAWQLRLAIDS